LPAETYMLSYGPMKTPLNVLIVDDDPYTRDLLKHLIDHEQAVNIVGMAEGVDQGIRLLTEKRADLVFLDIRMPEKDGFQFIEQMSGLGLDPGIIFVSAHDNYVIQAIRNSVFDYILKPITGEEVHQALERFREKGKKEPGKEVRRLMEMLRQSAPGKVKLNTRSGYILINPQEVVYCKADGNYTHIQLVNGNYELTTQNLGTIEEFLLPGGFFRASRSYLLNLRYLARVDRKNCSCIMEYGATACSIKIPSQKIKLLESSF